MPEPIFSLVSSAIRPENYKRCYNSFIQESKVPAEVVFVGNNPPKEFIGDYFKYIYATVKPAQCIEIGARESVGKYIIAVNDDNVFSDHFLDHVYQEINDLDTSKYILSFINYPSYIEGEKPREWSNGIIKIANYYGVEVGDYPCFPREIWKKIGGVDRKFIHTWWDLDMLLRCYEIGLILKLSQKAHIRERYPKLSSEDMDLYGKNRFFRKYEQYHTSLLEFLWVRAGFKVSKKRICSVESFEDKDIKTITQGEDGNRRWA